MNQKLKTLHIVLIAWLALATLYVVISEYNRVTNYVAKGAYKNGVRDAVVEVIQQATGECKAFPVTIDQQGVQLININCLQQNGNTTGQ